MSLLDERLARPLHKGKVAGGNRAAQAGNPACGDVLALHMRVADGRVEAASFESLGSPYQQAVASVLCEMVMGNSVAAARDLSAQDLLQRMPDLPARHRHLARIAVDALQAALA